MISEDQRAANSEVVTDAHPTLLLPILHVQLRILISRLRTSEDRFELVHREVHMFWIGMGFSVIAIGMRVVTSENGSPHSK
jgi:hypothetical protein